MPRKKRDAAEAMLDALDGVVAMEGVTPFRNVLGHIVANLPGNSPLPLVKRLFKKAAVDPNAHRFNKMDSGAVLDGIVDCSKVKHLKTTWLRAAINAGVSPWAWDDTANESEGDQTLALMVEGEGNPKVVLKVLATMVECDCFTPKGDGHRSFNEEMLDRLIEAVQAEEDFKDVHLFAAFVRRPTEQLLKDVLGRVRTAIAAERSKDAFITLIEKWKEDKLLYKMPNWAKLEPA
tara:strand:+ start:1140 stop:1841 length:702 start_codon:yes stop_codon:yes gene_type:complete